MDGFTAILKFGKTQNIFLRLLLVMPYHFLYLHLLQNSILAVQIYYFCSPRLYIQTAVYMSIYIIGSDGKHFSDGQWISASHRGAMDEKS